MKTKLLIALFGLLLCLGGSSCMVHRHAPKPPHKKGIPPGHAKKIRGKKSAKFDAPGHRNIFLLNCRYIKRKGIN